MRITHNITPFLFNGKVREVMAYGQVVLLKTLRCGEYAQTTVCKPE